MALRCLFLTNQTESLVPDRPIPLFVEVFTICSGTFWDLRLFSIDLESCKWKVRTRDKK